MIYYYDYVSVYQACSVCSWGMLQNQSFHREDNHGYHQQHIHAPRGFDLVEYFLSRMCCTGFFLGSTLLV